jgi:ABC-type sulfate/molybdate transport systems ATPase subunit
LANAYYIDQRLARWLLMCHDRIEGDVIEITHEYMALMLATRRVCRAGEVDAWRRLIDV